jgi:hypothetical protein
MTDTDAEAGQTIADARYDVGEVGRLYRLLFEDSKITLLRGDRGKHRLESRDTFDKYLRSGRFKIVDEEMETKDVEIDWSTVNGVGETTTDRLHDAGFLTETDMEKASLDELRAISGIGEKNAKNLLEYPQ